MVFQTVIRWTLPFFLCKAVIGVLQNLGAIRWEALPDKRKLMRRVNWCKQSWATGSVKPDTASKSHWSQSWTEVFRKGLKCFENRLHAQWQWWQVVSQEDQNPPEPVPQSGDSIFLLILLGLSLWLATSQLDRVFMALLSLHNLVQCKPLVVKSAKGNRRRSRKFLNLIPLHDDATLCLPHLQVRL